MKATSKNRAITVGYARPRRSKKTDPGLPLRGFRNERFGAHMRKDFIMDMSRAGTRGSLWSVLLVIALASLGGPAHAAWYVAPAAMGGSDSNPGTRAQPFLTLERARTAMSGSSDKTTYPRQGTYAR